MTTFGSDVITKYTPQYDGRSLDDLAAEYEHWAEFQENLVAYQKFKCAWKAIPYDVEEYTRLVMDDVLSDLEPTEPVL